MAEQRKHWAESDSHIIAFGDDFVEAGSFIGSAEDELALRETVLIDPDLFNGGEPVPEDSEPASHDHAIEALSELGDPEDSGEILPGPGFLEAGFHDEPEAGSVESCPEAESHIIIDEVPHEESDAFMGTAEDELAIRGVRRNDAEAAGSDNVPRDTPEPAEDEHEDFCEDWYLDWDPYMAEVRRRIGNWDKKHDKFSRRELSNEIYRYTDERLKSRYIIEKFGGVFEDGILGMDRELRQVDKGLWDAFIDDLCIMRLDLKRLDWDEIINERTRVCAENVSPSRIYGKDGDGMWGMKSTISDSLKSSQLIEKFNAEIRYDRQYDRMEVICDERLLDKAIADFADRLNRLKPLFLKEREQKGEFDRELYEISRAKAEAANAAEIVELRKELEAERLARQKAEGEIRRLVVENKELESRLAEKAKAAPGQEEAEKAAPSEPESRKREIDRIRHEWSDADLDMEERVLALTKELAPLEAGLSFWTGRLKSLEEAVDSEIRRYCEDTRQTYWTEAELDELPEYRDGKWAQAHPALVAWRKLTGKFWDKHRQELDEIKAEIRKHSVKCEDLRAEIIEEERKRAIHEKRYEALLAPYGASLDPAKMTPVSGVDDLLGNRDGLVADTVLPGLPLGQPGCLSGPAGLGKTQFMTQEALDISCGRNGLTKGGVLYIYGEDAKPFMERRRLATLSGTSPAFSESELADLRTNFIPWHLDGRRVDLADAQSEGSRVFRRNVRLIERDLRRRGVRLRLIVMDTLSVFSAGRENLSEHAHALLEALRRICMETGASLVFLHHTTKEAGAGGNTGAGSVRGHSRLTDDVRWVIILSGMTEKEARVLGVGPADRAAYVKRTFAKCNAIARHEPEWFRMTEAGVFVPADFGQGVAPKPLESGKLEIASATPVQPAGETPETSLVIPIHPKSESSEFTSQPPDSSGLDIGNAAGRPQSGRTGPASRAGSRRFDRSTGG